MDWAETYRELRIRNWFILLILALGSYLTAGPSLTIGIIAGGLIIIINFSFLQHTIRRVVPINGAVRTKKFLIIFKSFFRLFLLGTIIYLLITRGWIDPIGLTIGLSTVVFSIISFGIHRAYKDRVREAV